MAPIDIRDIRPPIINPKCIVEPEAPAPRDVEGKISLVATNPMYIKENADGSVEQHRIADHRFIRLERYDGFELKQEAFVLIPAAVAASLSSVLRCNNAVHFPRETLVRASLEAATAMIQYGCNDESSVETYVYRAPEASLLGAVLVNTHTKNF